MTCSSQSRRQFLATSGLIAAGLANVAPLRGQAPAGTVTRKNLAPLNAGSPDIQAFSTAYQAMLQISMNDPTDPHGWTYQANMHGVSPPDDLGPDGLWNQCQHGSFWFFPWHRMYLYFFERIIRKYSGVSTFAMPYWYWDDPTGSQLSLNSIFLPGGPLFIAEPDRGALANSGQPIDTIDSILNDPQTGKNAAMGEPFYISQNDPAFGGPVTTTSTHGGELHGLLEGDGHDQIHGDVGGRTGWMNDPLRAARDPIFWFHHANVDRIWLEWIGMGGGRVNPDPTTPIGKLWSQQKFTFFDENKQKVTMTPADVLDTVKLGYTYEALPNAAPVVAAAALPSNARLVTMNQAHAQPAAPSVAESVERSPQLSASPVRLTFKLNDTARGHLNRVAAHDVVPSPSDKTSILLRIHGIDAEKSRGASIGIYLNLAPGEKPPGVKDPHYAGSISLFRHAHGHMGINATLSITRVIRKLKKAGLWKDDADFSVTLVQREPLNKKETTRVIPFEKASLEVYQ